MTNPADIQSALSDLEPGDKVLLKLADGREIEGRLAESDAGHVQLTDSDAVDLDQVEDVLIQVESEGIE